MPVSSRMKGNQVCASDCYGKEGGKALMGTFHIIELFAPGDIDVATEYSKRLGTELYECLRITSMF
ncbi:TraG/TraD/VirD4 family protein [Rahnella perminowiae]|uniref:TraG/TraD/VirD4 family protein n=1 Tax=Rahnella perminowiae TaxID=2816244 RepID=UPI00215CF592|nr:TraG/TraD/VirD4 family protein [Rahnella perminowiae]MCR8998634.1 TraG/TraD/VirD4 family protein [Rahnella perminowiae]